MSTPWQELGYTAEEWETARKVVHHVDRWVDLIVTTSNFTPEYKAIQSKWDETFKMAWACRSDARDHLQRRLNLLRELAVNEEKRSVSV